MHGNSARGNRETPSTPIVQLAAGRLEKAMSRKSSMYVDGESDGCVVPTKCPNNGGQPSAEGMEGRRPTRENIAQATAPRTQSRISELSDLSGVRKAAGEKKRTKFTALLHHVTVGLLRDSYYALKRDAAPGVDGLTRKEYETELEPRLANLHSRVHLGTYRAQPSKRAYIPKADGRQRPLGIAALEDKIVQQALSAILNQIYEEDFMGFSYGFRPGRSQHQALDALWVGIMRKKVNWVLDAEIRGFFDNMSHEWTMQFVEHRVADRRILRLIRKWLRAGVSEEGNWSKTEVGTPQGAVISPLLANIYLHYAFDLWVKHWREHQATGDMVVVRYADDIVVGFENRTDAERFLSEWRERMQKFGLELHPDKTRLIEFGRHASENRKRLSAKLKELKEELRRRWHEPVAEVGRWLKSVVRGYFNYHAVPGNMDSLNSFRAQVIWRWYRALRRRSQRAKVTWERFWPLVDRWIPSAKILHPHPNVRFDAIHPR
jgi:group II intron reverse transcriptase/maturase